MAGTQSISGLSSGIDWQTMIDQLIAVDRKQVTLVENQQSTLESKKSTWATVASKITSLKTIMENLAKASTFNKYASSLSSSSSTAASDMLALTVGTEATVGNFQIEIERLAQLEKISSASFSSTSSSLNLSGEFLLGNRRISIESTDSLTNIRDKINLANSGSNPSGVTAAITSVGTDSYRIVLSATSTGAQGISIRDASATQIVQSLGFTSGSTAIKNATSAGAKSDAFTSTDSSVVSMLGLSGAPSSAAIQIGAYTNISINLNQSLTQIKDSINTQTGAQIASIETETDESGASVYRLKLIGTTYADGNNVLKTLGVLKGTYQNVSEVVQGNAMTRTTAAGGGVLLATSTFAEINTGSGLNNIQNGDTITISGTDHAGEAVSGTFTIANKSTATLQDLLTQIQNVFGAHGRTVTASFDANGKLTVTDATSGSSDLAVSLTANNQGGGTLDFGTMATSTEGRAMQIQAGQDSTFVVDGVRMTRGTNEVSDVISGVTLNLRKAEDGTTVSVGISRDKEAIRQEVSSFISEFNSITAWTKSQLSYDNDTKKTGGPLFGDSTLTTLQNQLYQSVIHTVSGASSTLNTLKGVGVSLGSDGQLSLDSSVFDNLVDTDFDNLLNLFTVRGSGSTGSLTFVSSTDQTQGGTFAVNVTQAASQGGVTGSADLSGGLGGNETLTVTDSASGSVASFNLTSGMSLSDIVAALNSEFARTYTKVLTESVAHTKTSAAGGGAITTSTKFSEINTGGDANDLQAGDRISFSGVTRGGVGFDGSFTISDPTTDTFGDLMEEIQNTFGDRVTLSLDATGRILVTETSSGASLASLNLSYSGAGSLSFGTMDTTTTGRSLINITASDDGSGHLKLTHNDYGSSRGFSVAQTANHLGITDQSYYGTNVAGTINGELATGNGQLLSGNSGNINTDGLVIRYTGSATGAVGNFSLTLGFAEPLQRLLNSYDDTYEGYITIKSNGLKDSIDSMTKQIDLMNARLEQRREMMISRFTKMEKALAALQTQSSWLSSQLASLSAS